MSNAFLTIETEINTYGKIIENLFFWVQYALNILKRNPPQPL